MTATLSAQPGECPQPHRYRIYCAALDALIGGTFATAEAARVQYDLIPEDDEPIWDVIHADGSQCVREAQRQEILSISLDFDEPDNPQCPTDLGAERCCYDAGHDGACETAQDVQQRTVGAGGCGR